MTREPPDERARTPVTDRTPTPLLLVLGCSAAFAFGWLLTAIDLGRATPGEPIAEREDHSPLRAATPPGDADLTGPRSLRGHLEDEVRPDPLLNSTAGRLLLALISGVIATAVTIAITRRRLPAPESVRPVPVPTVRVRRPLRSRSLDPFPQPRPRRAGGEIPPSDPRILTGRRLLILRDPASDRTELRSTLREAGASVIELGSAPLDSPQPVFDLIVIEAADEHGVEAALRRSGAGASGAPLPPILVLPPNGADPDGRMAFVEPGSKNLGSGKDGARDEGAELREQVAALLAPVATPS